MDLDTPHTSRIDGEALCKAGTFLEHTVVCCGEVSANLLGGAPFFITK
jgi:hypothetical protein